MPSREEMIAALQEQDQKAGPSREEMIRALQEQDSGAGSLPEPKRHSKADASIMAGLQGAAAGFLDELSGAGEAAGRVVGVKGLGGQFSDVELDPNGPTLDRELLKEAYVMARDKKRQLLADQSKEYPVETGVAGVAGALFSPANKLAKGLSMAKGGAIIGGVNSLGASDAKDARGMLIDTATGTAIGLAAGKGLEKVAGAVDKGASKLGAKTKELAERFAGRALGAERATIKKLGQDKVQAAGRQALDEGALRAFGSTDDTIARNIDIKKKGGALMDEAFSAIDDKGASTFNPLKVAAEVDDKLAPTYRTPINKGETNQLENTLESILARGDKNIPLREAQKLKEEIGSVAFPGGKRPFEPTPKQQMAMDAYRIVNKSIDDAAKAGSDIIEKAGLSDKLAKGKLMFGNARTAEKLLQNKQAREQGNKFIGLTDSIVGGAGLGYGGTTGDWQTAVGVMAGKKYLEKYGAQQAALALNKLSKSMLKAPHMTKLAEKAPAAYQSVVATIAKSGKSLQKAAENKSDPEIKGEDKWVVDGVGKLMDHGVSEEQIAKLAEGPGGRRTFISASDLKPKTKAMENLLKKKSGG